MGHAVYPVLADHQDVTLFHMMTNMTHTTVTQPPTSQTGSTGAVQNFDRPQSLGGDLFLEHSGALVVNQDAGWSADVTQNRLGTTTSNSDYNHTFAGLGGFHDEGGYGLHYESAPISAYCDLKSAYGNSSNYLEVGSGDALCGPISFHPADFAIFTR